jgi:hypothetical protein
LLGREDTKWMGSILEGNDRIINWEEINPNRWDSVERRSSWKYIIPAASIWQSIPPIQREMIHYSFGQQNWTIQPQFNFDSDVSS